MAALDARRAGSWLFAVEAWDALAARARAALDDYHRRSPLRGGMPREELQSRLGLPPAAFAAVLPALAADGVLVDRAGEVARPGHTVEIDSADGPAAALLEVLGRQRFAPPSLPEAMREAGAGPELVRAMVQKGSLVRVSEDIAFTREAYDAAVDLVRSVAARDGSVTVGSMRDAMGSARRPVLALLEHLDSERITRRVGDARVLRG